MTILIPDFRWVAKAIPEERTLYGRVSCTLGYSHALQRLFRFENLPPHASKDVPRWTSVSGQFAKSTYDSRFETYLAAGPLELGSKISPRRGMDEVAAFLCSGTTTLNEQRRSIGVLCPKSFDAYWTPNEDRHSGGITGQPLRLRLRYQSEDGKSHDQTVLDWQYYEAVRRFQNRYTDPYDRAIERLLDPSYQTLLMVGNQKAHRNAWLVVGVLQTKL